MKLKRRMTSVASAIAMVVAAGGAVAAAAEPADAGGAPDTGEKRAPAIPDSKLGLAILAGGGVTDFTQASTRDETGVGGFWDIRLVAATRHWIGFEASYIGGANEIKGLGLHGDSKLVRNGIEGAVRVQAPFIRRRTLLEPYLLGGVGWTGYRLTNVNTDTSSLTTGGDNTVSLPFGAGFMVGYRGFLGDLRYTMRPTYDQTLLADQGPRGLTNWDAGAMIGFEF